jgi:hypothetical protein
MKKHILLMILSIVMIFPAVQMKAGSPSPQPGLKLKIAFSSRAYWDGVTKSCLPRERGWCLHISINILNTVPDGIIIGEVSNDIIDGMTLTFKKQEGITAETFTKFFRNGKFVLDGEGTMEDAIAKKLGMRSPYTIPAGSYDYKEKGGYITISFKR